MTSFEERNRLLAAEPSGVLQFDAINLEAPAFCFSKAAYHQRGGERPWLGGEVLHRAAADGSLLVDFAPNGSLDRFSGLDEPRQRRIHALREPRLAAEQTSIAIDSKHDDDRIGAREVDRLANRAIPSPARHRDPSERAAIGAEPVTRVPIHERLRRGQHRRLVLRHEAAHRDRAQVDELQILPARHDQNPPIEKAVAGVCALFDSLVRQQSDENWPAVWREAQERLDLGAAKRLDLAHRQEGIESLLGIAQDRHIARDQERARLLADPQASDFDRVLASIRAAIKPIDDIAEAFESRQDLTSFKGSEPGAPRPNLTEAQPEAAAQG